MLKSAFGRWKLIASLERYDATGPAPLAWPLAGLCLSRQVVSRNESSDFLLLSTFSSLCFLLSNLFPLLPSLLSFTSVYLLVPFSSLLFTPFLSSLLSHCHLLSNLLLFLSCLCSFLALSFTPSSYPFLTPIPTSFPTDLGAFLLDFARAFPASTGWLASYSESIVVLEPQYNPAAQIPPALPHFIQQIRLLNPNTGILSDLSISLGHTALASHSIPRVQLL